MPALAHPACIDDAALAELVRAYHLRLVRYGRRVCRDDSDTDDAVWQAFEKLSRRPDVATGTSPLGWLLAVVRTTCRKLLRPFARERRYLGERDDVGTAPADAADDPMARWELARTVHAAIASLDRASREVIVLRDLEGLSAEETCRVLGLTLPAMKSRLHRARGELRERLEG